LELAESRQRQTPFDNRPTLIPTLEFPMHSFVSCLLHVVFSTQDRRPLITPDIQERLWPYLGGIARKNKMKILRAGGVEDHVHLLISLPATPCNC
jgi:REP element-mobilizing transposase RayT